MSSSKLILVAIAIVAVGLFALPSSVSLFSGQHTWYNLGETAGSDVPCDKCHADINAEMISTGNGAHDFDPYIAPGCNCHRVDDTRITTEPAYGGYPEGGSPTPGNKSHAAETIACMICHEQGNQPAYPFAGGFDQAVVYEGSTPVYYYNHSDGSGGEHAAHNQFIREAILDPLMEDSNEACIACHTRIGVNITWTKNKVMAFDATEGAQGDWSLTGFTAEGDDVVSISYPNDWTG
nr:hypothetical secreted protein [uncultured archaeon]